MDSLIRPLASGEANDSARYESSMAVDITAWVRDVKKRGSIESCNCKQTGQHFQDVHIELVPTKTTKSKKKILVAELTPRLRNSIFNQLGMSMSNTALSNKIKGRQVRVEGWLMYDWEHENDSVNSDPNEDKGPKNRRATVWEIHPVTSLELVP